MNREVFRMRRSYLSARTADVFDDHYEGAVFSLCAFILDFDGLPYEPKNAQPQILSRNQKDAYSVCFGDCCLHVFQIDIS